MINYSRAKVEQNAWLMKSHGFSGLKYYILLCNATALHSIFITYWQPLLFRKVIFVMPLSKEIPNCPLRAYLCDDNILIII
ncbi:hypothetical protein FKM82_006656 [Ascaphus truei]